MKLSSFSHASFSCLCLCSLGSLGCGLTRLSSILIRDSNSSSPTFHLYWPSMLISLALATSNTVDLYFSGSSTIRLSTLPAHEMAFTWNRRASNGLHYRKLFSQQTSALDCPLETKRFLWMCSTLKESKRGATQSKSATSDIQHLAYDKHGWGIYL